MGEMRFQNKPLTLDMLLGLDERTIPFTPLLRPQESGLEGSQEESSFGWER